MSWWDEAPLAPDHSLEQAVDPGSGLLTITVRPSDTHLDPKAVIDFWKSKGFSDEQAHGITRRLMDESALNPIAFNPQGGGEGALGLGQWRGARQEALRQFGNFTDPLTQLNFAWDEMQGGDPGAVKARNAIKNAKSEKQAYDAFTQYFERPGPAYSTAPSAVASAMARPGTSVVHMPPADYLALSPPLDVSRETPAFRDLAASMGRGEPITDLPSLDVSETSPGSLAVTEQDGRNRAMAAQEAGLPTIPVAINGVSGTPNQITGMRPGAQPQPFAFPSINPIGQAQAAPANWWEAAPLAAPPAAAQPPLPAPPPRSASPFSNIVAGALGQVLGAPPGVLTGGRLSDIATGLRTVLGGAAQLGYNALPSAVTGPVNAANNWLADQGLPIARLGPGGVNELETARQNALVAQRGPTPTLGEMAGEALGTAPLAMMAPAGILGAAGVGAAAGALSPVTGPDYWSGAGANALAGGLTGGALGLGGKILSNIAMPAMSPQANSLAQEGVRMTPGQMAGGLLRRAENSMASVPGLGTAIRSGVRRSVEDFNRAAWNRVLAPLGENLPDSVPVGREATNFADAAIDRAYSKVIPNLRAYADRDFVTSLGEIGTRAKADLPDSQWGTFKKLMHSQLVEKASAPADGAALNGIDSKLGEEARGYRSDPDYDKRKMGRYIEEVHLAFRSALERQNPAYADQLRGARDAYANYVRVSRAASSIGAKDGVFSPAQLGNAVRASDPSLRHMAYGRGKALMQDLSDAGQAVLPSNVPDSGTPERLLVNNLLGIGIGGSAAYLDPHTLIAAGALSLPYTSPGMNMLHRYATAFPAVRNMLSRGLQMGTRAAVPAAGLFGPALLGDGMVAPPNPQGQ